jgi:LacI family transcriptional regulator
MAGGVVSLAQSRGVRIPDALEVVGFDDTPISRQLFPALTTIRQPITEMAEQATAALIDAVAHPGADPQDTILDYVLVERASTGSCL